MRKKQSVSLLAAIETIARNGGRPLPRQQIADYLADAHAFLKSSRQRALYDPADVAALARAVEAFESSLATGDVYLVACRALEAGGFRFLPGANKALRRDEHLKHSTAKANTQRAKDADSEALNRFRDWERRASSQLAGKGVDEKLRLFCKLSKAPDRVKRRVRTLARAGKL